MEQRIKVGDVYLEIPKNSSISVTPASQANPTKAEKSDTPEPLEEPQYVYRPNDPFQSAIDEARAIASISTSHKPWIKKTWFILFVIGPLFYAELFALALVVNGAGVNPFRVFLSANAIILPIWYMYYTISRKKVKE